MEVITVKLSAKFLIQKGSTTFKKGTHPATSVLVSIGMVSRQKIIFDAAKDLWDETYFSNSTFTSQAKNATYLRKQEKKYSP